jgi:hypothetical protein
MYNNRLGGPQSRYRLYEDKKNVLPVPGIKPRLHGRSARSLVAIETELFRLYDPVLIWIKTNMATEVTPSQTSGGATPNEI